MNLAHINKDHREDCHGHVLLDDRNARGRDEDGQRAEEGDILVILESMKMGALQEPLSRARRDERGKRDFRHARSGEWKNMSQTIEPVISTEELKFEIIETIGIITINRPDVGNAVGGSMSDTIR